ncbi:MAG: penicillin-binding protein activator [Thermodesulfobacteriota bacterium]
MNRHHRVSAAPRLLLLPAILALVLGLTAAGCAKKVIPVEVPRVQKQQAAPAQPAPAPSPALDPRAAAEAAWRGGDHAESERLYRLLLDRGGLSAADEATALERLAGASLENAHPRLALEALDRLAQVRPGTADTWEWQRSRARALWDSGRREESMAGLDVLSGDATLPYDLRMRASLALARTRWLAGQPDRAMAGLSGFYAAAPADAPAAGPSPRAELEAGLARDLAAVEDRLLAALAQAAPDPTAFPGALVTLEQTRRRAQDPANLPAALQSLSALAQNGALADTSLVDALTRQILATHAGPSRTLALALPLTGPYADFGFKVLRGAAAAQWDMAGRGAGLDIVAVNTESPEWPANLSSLPADTLLLGGPLRAERFRSLLAAGHHRRLPVMAFLSGLAEAAEGQDAWRFFPGMGDQVRTLARLCVADLGVSRLAVLHPEEPFGSKLAEEFRSAVAAAGGSTAKVASYPPREPQKWNETVRLFLGARKGSGKNVPLPPEPDFRAVFLPDGWSQAQALAPQFFFYDEERLVLLGPSLWAQNITPLKEMEIGYFRLAVFPAAFWPDNPAPGARALAATLEKQGLGAPDFWAALGFDFVRFAALLPPLPPVWTPADVNNALAKAPNLDWSMAPLAFDPAGRASQSLFLFQPSTAGMAPLSLLDFRDNMERSDRRHAARVKIIQEMQARAHAKKAGAPAKAPEDGEAPAQRLDD